MWQEFSGSPAPSAPVQLCCAAVARDGTRLWQKLLPWTVSALALGYVFGYATNWDQLVEATSHANVPLYVAFTVLDKLIFFLWWGILQAKAVRRFVGPIPTRQVLSIRGGAELVRTVNGPLSDAAFMFGVSRLTGGEIAAVAAAVGVPFVCHFTILLVQASIALIFLEGGPSENLDVVFIVVAGWLVVGSVVLLLNFGPFKDWFRNSKVGRWTTSIGFKALSPFLLGFSLFAVFDVLIQGLASRAFGIVIDWWALTARLPILYSVLALPSFGNFGTRELTWAASFSDFAPHDSLVAYALATNTIFLMLHVVIGVIFLPRAIRLISEMRRAQREGETVRVPILRKTSEP